MREGVIKIPVGFFIFNRLDTTEKVFEEIRKYRPQKLYLISDAARVDLEGEDRKVEEVRAYIENNIDWPCEVYKNYADSNMGCRRRMASGITWLFEREEMAVILEDDCKPTQDFFLYMEELLHKYKDDGRVAMISGCKTVRNYPMDNSYTFSRFPAIWGWGTWRRAWDYYDIDIRNWPILKRTNYFRQFYNFYGYLKVKHNFESVYAHKYDTWDYQWTYAMLINKGLNIVPNVNMIKNLGFGREDATHTKEKTKESFFCESMIFPLQHPNDVEADEEYDKAYKNYNWGIRAIFSMLGRKIKKSLLKK